MYCAIRLNSQTEDRESSRERLEHSIQQIAPTVLDPMSLSSVQERLFDSLIGDVRDQGVTGLMEHGEQVRGGGVRTYWGSRLRA